MTNCWPQVLRQILPDQARADVGRAARRIADEPAHGMVRIILGRTRRAGRAGAGKRKTRKAKRDEPLEPKAASFSPSHTRPFFLVSIAR